MKTKYQIATLATVLTFGAVMVFVFQNCGAPTFATDPNGDAAVKAKAEELTKLSTTIKTMSAQDLSCATDDDCQPLGLGVKGCGGPTEYIVVSRHNPDLHQIVTLADQFNTQSAAANQNSGLVSDCRIMEPPPYRCVASQCQ